MTLTLSPEQRDALYDQILDRLSGIGDIELAIEKKDFQTAERVGRKYSDELRLLLDDLGIGEGTGQPIELSSPPDVLRRLLPTLRDGAAKYSEGQEPGWLELMEIRERNRLVVEACDSVLGELAGVAEGEPT
jgi:hypothetical protein